MKLPIYMKSGLYTCQVCKRNFTAHNIIFLSKEKGYACPHCKCEDFIEEEKQASTK